MTSDPELLLRCEELVELVTDYLDGAIDDARLELVEAHLGICDPCVLYVEQMRAAISTLGQLPKDEAVDQAQRLPEPVREHLLDAFRAEH